MEDQAPYGLPKGPRNLAAAVAAWLRAQGWTALEQSQDTYCVLTATWISPRFERFEFTYTWQAGPAPAATCQLRVLSHQLGSLVEPLFAAQHVRRVRDVRQLIAGCVRYANARLLSRPQPIRL